MTTSPVVRKAPWRRRHPMQASLLVVATVIVLVAGITVLVRALNAPALDCGPGMAANASATACIGVDLASDPISPTEPAKMGALEADIRANNNAVSGDYISLVLLLDLSPVRHLDTMTYPDLYRNIEGAVTAAWQVNHTAAYGSVPKIKLFLANMGSRNADWSAAVEQIAANRKVNHITSVVGLGQSTTATRHAAATLTEQVHLPVIGATVTGDTMNRDPRTNALLTGFFRVAPTNSDTVAAAARYIRSIQHNPAHVAIVQDTVAADDYTATLGAAVDKAMPSAHQFPFTSPNPRISSLQRDQALIGQFTNLDVNVCAVAPTVVYFAGRGTDLGAFVQSWIQSNTQCSHKPLLIISGDDASEAIGDTQVTSAVGKLIQVRYTALASPGEWGPCPLDSPDDPKHEQAAGARGAYDQFQAAFTGKPACDTSPSTVDNATTLSYKVGDLDSGQAMITHDAVAVATTAARRTGRSAVSEPISQVGVLQELRCVRTFPGASGSIQYSADRHHYGNPIGTTLPILNITATGTATTVSSGWKTAPLTGSAPASGC